MEMVKTFAFSPDAVVMLPLKKEVAFRGSQGLAKDDCATECLGGKKWNSTVSPTFAVMVDGSKTRASFPTVTEWTGPDDEAVLAAAAEVTVVEVPLEPLP